MADFRTTLGINTSEYDSGLENSKKKTEQFKDSADQASDSVKGLGKQGRSTADILKDLNKVEGDNRSVSNYRQQLMKLTRQIQDLTINYRNMSSEMKNSPLGQETAAKIQELTIKAGQYKDAIVDAQNSIKVLASDTAAWDAMKQGIDVVSSSLQAMAASGVLGAKSTEKLVQVIAKVKAIEVGANAAIKIGNALQKQSALMMGISTLQAKALAAAKSLETKATIGATAAQKGFNIIAKANPYVLLATAVIAVGAALYTFAKKEREATEAEKKHKENLEKERKAYDDYVKDVSEKTADLVSKYKLLQIEWSKLTRVSDKKRWIKENQTEFQNLGLKVNDLISAEKTFVNNTDTVVDALKKRAIATAKQAQLVELYRRLFEEQQRADAEYNRRKVSTGSKVGGSGHSTAGGNEYVDRNGAWVYTEKGANEANKRIYNETHANANKIQAEIDKLAAEIAGSIDISTIFKPTSGGASEEDNTVVGSLKAAQKEATRLRGLLENTNPEDANFGKIKQDLIDAEEEVKRLQKLVSTDQPIEYINNSLAEAQHFVQVFQAQLQDLDPNTDEFREVLELLNIWKKRAAEINEIINGTAKSQKTLVEQYQEIVSKAADISLQVKIGAISREEGQNLINNLNKTLEDLGLTIRVKLDIDNQSVKTITDKMNDFVDSMDRVSSMSSAISSINGVYKSISELSDKLSEAQNGWESFFTVFELGVEIFNTATTIIEALATATEILTGIKEAHAAATTAEAAAATADATAQTADGAATAGNAAAHGAAAAAKAGESVSSIPYVGPVLAIAAIAAVMAAIIAAISSAQSFSTGGVVGGNSYTGDKILARLNSQEVVLNKNQQNKLWGMMNNTESNNNNNIGGQVEFKIQGTQLVGVLNNMNKKNFRI